MKLMFVLKLGQRYMQLFPNDAALAASFPEIKIIYYLKLAKIYLPPVIIALFIWQYYLHTELPITIITVLFALSLPIQGFFFLGKRALSPLPLNLLNWYNNVKQQLIEKEILSAKNDTANNINFIEFIKLLNLAKLHLGSYFGLNDNASPPFIN